MITKSDNHLLAIVSVDQAERVRCGQPGCGHSVYVRVHVVRVDGELMVLCSTCFAMRFGGADAMGSAFFGGGGKGRLLTVEERQMLLNNTESLLAQFEDERAQAAARQSVSLETRSRPVPSPNVFRHLNSGSDSPWAWMKPLSSTIYFRLKDGSGWVRVQCKDGKHFLMAWPVFDGWDEALPAHVGIVNSECEGYTLTDVIGALKYLRSLAEWETSPGRWKDVAAEVARRTLRIGFDVDALAELMAEGDGANAANTDDDAV